MKHRKSFGTRAGGINGLLICLLLLGLITSGCSAYKASLRTKDTGSIDPSGTYTVIRVGGGHSEDYATFALIVPEGGKYKFDIYKPSFDYSSSGGLTAKQAVNMATVFVSAQTSFVRSQTSGIIGPDGSVIGYEVRPLYRQILFGRQDLIIIDYLLKEQDIVEVRVDLDDVVKRHQMGGSGRQRDRR